jgi:hypothetical protein
MPENATETITVKFLKNGDLTTDNEGTPLLIAHYNRLSGELEYATREYSSRFHAQVTAAIGSVNKGTETSGLVIRSISVKGMPKGDPAKRGKCPPLGPLGDAAEEVVQFYIDTDPEEARIRYRIYTNKDGSFVRKDVRRLLVETVDRRVTHEDDQLPWNRMGQGEERNPVAREGEYLELKNQIIAGRSTPLTFLPQEVVGGWRPEEEL